MVGSALERAQERQQAAGADLAGAGAGAAAAEPAAVNHGATCMEAPSGPR